MRRLVALGGGTAGTMVVNRLHRRLGSGWQITVIDHDVGEIDLVDTKTRGLGGLPGMTTMATHQMRKQIDGVGVPDVHEFLAQIVDSGGHLWACRLSAEMMHLQKDDLYDPVEGIISASDFIEMTEGAQLPFI